jgi:hypothetical protein
MSLAKQSVIPGREVGVKIAGFVNFAPPTEPGIHNHHGEYGLRACATLCRLSPTGMAHPRCAITHRGMTPAGSVKIETPVEIETPWSGAA